jgi:hypothetical protein
VRRFRRERQLLCATTGKFAYRDRLAARMALAEVANKGRDEHHVYRCPGTSHWHLTSKQR